MGIIMTMAEIVTTRTNEIPHPARKECYAENHQHKRIIATGMIPMALMSIAIAMMMMMMMMMNTTTHS
jgi:hypothetical protein